MTAYYNPQNKETFWWQRADSITIRNAVPPDVSTVTFSESLTTVIDGQVIQRKLGDIVERLVIEGENNNLNESFPLLHPVTGEPLGVSSSYADAQVLLYSLYLHVASKRDTANQPVEE